MAGIQARILTRQQVVAALRRARRGRHPRRDRVMLRDSAAKKGSGRTIPLHHNLRRALQQLRREIGAVGAVIHSERGGFQGMRPGSVVNWFRVLYRDLGLDGCSSHSGRRTFITNAAKRRVIELI